MEYNDTRNIRYTHKTMNGFVVNSRRGLYDLNILVHELDRNEYRITKEMKTIIDIGAHLGGTSMYAARLGVKSFALEPDPTNFKLLKKNVDENRLNDKIVCIEKAVGTGDSNKKFYLHKTNSGASGFFPNNDGSGVHDSVIVDVIDLEDLFKEYNIEHCDLLKLDCEGAEYQILYNLDVKYFDIIDSIVMEIHREKGEKKEINMKNRHDLLKYLEKFYSVQEEITKSVFLLKKHA